MCIVSDLSIANVSRILDNRNSRQSTPAACAQQSQTRNLERGGLAKGVDGVDSCDMDDSGELTDRCTRSNLR